MIAIMKDRQSTLEDQSRYRAASLDALSMDPHSTNNSFTNAFVGNIYESLVRFNEKLQIEPALATAWKVQSPTVWRFTLRQGVKFHNGKDFTSADVRYTFNELFDKKGYKSGAFFDTVNKERIPHIAAQVDALRRAQQAVALMQAPLADGPATVTCAFPGA